MSAAMAPAASGNAGLEAEIAGATVRVRGRPGAATLADRRFEAKMIAAAREEAQKAEPAEAAIEHGQNLRAARTR